MAALFDNVETVSTESFSLRNVVFLDVGFDMVWSASGDGLAMPVAKHSAP